MEVKKFQIEPELVKDFKIKNVDFTLSRFEEIMIQDVYAYDETSKVKLNRDMTQEFFNELKMTYDEKRNQRHNIKGETRSGKSLIGLKEFDIYCDYYGKDFNSGIEKAVCGNQVEYRLKLKTAEFGDFYLIDENFFTRAGHGANIEAGQLLDYNNIIAKKNIHNVFITPSQFIRTGATLGLAYYGRDNNNWLSRFLVYKFKDNIPFLIGYVVFNIGKLFQKHGCYLYKTFGGCTNPNKKLFEDINPLHLKFSRCIPKDYDKTKLVINKESCPFYNVCTHGLCKYEKKKDSWIEKELKGGLDERTGERFLLSVKIILYFSPYYDEEKNILQFEDIKSFKELKVKLKLALVQFTNTKFSITEEELLSETIKANLTPSSLFQTLESLEKLNYLEHFFNIENGLILEQKYEEYKEKKKLMIKLDD